MADITRLAAVAEARPDAQLIVDSNEGWQIDELARYANQLGRYGVTFSSSLYRKRKKPAGRY